MEFLDRTLLDNTYLAWLIAVGAGLLAVLVLRTLQAITRQRLARLAARSPPSRWALSSPCWAKPESGPAC
jgi:predicted lysophospholipase L1 biosynthesis ABC-type transport system permease subunit